MIRSAVAFDAETRPIVPGVQAPPVVSLQWTEISNNRISAPDLMGGAGSYTQILDTVYSWLDLPGLFIYGANTAYDMLCCVSLAGRIYGYAAAEDMLTRVFAKYRASEVSDVLTRQKMIDLAAGCYRGFARDDGKWIRYGYNLADVTFRHTGRRLDKGVWELRYGELEDVPLGQWPLGAVEYARDDGLATGQVTAAQTHYPRAVRDNFPGLDPLTDEWNQARGAFWLKLISVWGIRTNPEAVAAFGEQVKREYFRLANELADDRVLMRDGTRQALVYREFKLDRQAIVARAKAIGKLEMLTSRGAAGEAKITLAHEPLLRTGDQLLSLCAIWRTIKEGLEELPQKPNAVRAFNLLKENGLADCTFHRSTKAAADRMIQVCTGQNTVVKLTEGNGIALDKEVCDSTGDPLLQSYAELSSLGKTVSNDIPALKSGIYFPIHTRYEEYLDTNRTSSSNPNIQNVRRLPGIRECFVPRAGHVIIDADYKMLELFCLAQICLWQFGWSKLAETLLNRLDPHLQVGCTMLGIPYETGKVRYAANDGVISNARDCGKVGNFGIPGGLGPDTLVTYAAKSYGVKITRAQAVQIRDDFFRTYPEVQDYMRTYVAGLETYPDSKLYNIVDPYSGRLRAGATFCAACNDGFQGMGANVAKLAGWYVAEACYVNKNDALFGCRIINFIHDQFLVEALEHLANAASVSLAYHMDRAAKQVLPDCPSYASVLTSRVWSKKAKRIEIDGIQVPWDQEKVA